MYSQSDIEDAVEGGAITEDQAANLRSFVARRNGVPTADEEYARIVLGFNDIFVFIACGFAIVAVAMIGNLIPPEMSGMRGSPLQSPFAGLFVAAASWGLSEIFTRKRHTALPSLVLVATFSWGVALFVLVLLGAAGGMRGEGGALIMSLSMVAGGGAAFLHWRRFKEPVAIATIVGFLIIALIAIASVGIGGRDAAAILFLVTGVGAFLCAMWWDSQDVLRRTRTAEVAFWLHWLAAGLVVNSLTQLFGLNNGIDSVAGAIGVLVLYLVFALIALAIDRKALLISGLVPLLLAIRSLVTESSYRSYGSGYSDYGRYNVPASPYGSPYSTPYPTRSYGGSSGSVEGTMITVTIIGILLLLLAIYWAPLRRVVVGLLPESLRAKLPPTGTEPAEQASTFE